MRSKLLCPRCNVVTANVAALAARGRPSGSTVCARAEFDERVGAKIKRAIDGTVEAQATNCATNNQYRSAFPAGR
jgi:hypothetical protein